MEHDEWIDHGMAQGFCGPPICVTHDGLPTTVEEEEAFQDGGETCMHILRLYNDAITKAAIEENHPPSVWRATNRTPPCGDIPPE